MPTLNTFTGMGHLTREPAVKTSQSGMMLAHFTLALQTGQDKACFLDVTAFKENAEKMKDAKKGGLVLIHGKLDQDNWQDKQTGQKRSKVKCLADKLEYVRDAKSHGKPTNGDEEQAYTERYGHYEYDAGNYEGEDTGSLPF